MGKFKEQNNLEWAMTYLKHLLNSSLLGIKLVGEEEQEWGYRER